MKNILIGLAIICAALLSSVCFAGEIKSIPAGYHIQLTEPTTEKYEFLSVEFRLGAAPYAVVKYNVVDSTGAVRGSHAVEIRNITDDPETPENETSTAFTDFVAGYGATLYSRSDAKILTSIQSKYNVTQD